MTSSASETAFLEFIWEVLNSLLLINYKLKAPKTDQNSEKLYDVSYLSRWAPKG